MNKSRHRCFRLTQPEYMEGKRVKTRLRYLSYLGCLTQILIVFPVFVGSIIFLNNIGWNLGSKTTSALVALSTLGVINWMLKRTFVHWGWMSEKESQFFPINGSWPEDWLEPIPGHSPTAISEKESETKEVAENATEVEDGKG